jgi:hypothetical protein
VNRDSIEIVVFLGQLALIFAFPEIQVFLLTLSSVVVYVPAAGYAAIDIQIGEEFLKLARSMGFP